MTDEIKQHLVRAQHRIKVQADKRRSDIPFQVGDKVFLQLQSYVQSSLARRTHQKLAFKFFRPYHITEKIGTVAYRLALPAGSTIHRVFHVSQLKKMATPSLNVSPTLPDPSATVFQVLEKVLDTRVITRGDSEVHQILIKWPDMNTKLVTWEDSESLRYQFSAAPAWSQADSQTRGNVSIADTGRKETKGRHARNRNSEVYGPD
jgi:hypothetical protein